MKQDKELGFNKLSVKVKLIPKLIAKDTRLKLSSISSGVKVKIYDKSNNFVK